MEFNNNNNNNNSAKHFFRFRDGEGKALADGHKTLSDLITDISTECFN
jgi:hypothetical protein